MRPFFAPVGAASLLVGGPLLAGCGAVAAAKSVRTYAVPVASAPPAGTIRIVPQTPVVTPTKAHYEWQVVCDAQYHAFSSTNSETTISGGSPVSRLKGELTTAFVYFIDVETKPHGDGSMSISITEGHRDIQTRPLLQPSARPGGGGAGYGGSGSDGQNEVPASTFVRRLVVASTDLKVPGSIDLARIEVPSPAYGTISAVKYGPKGAEKTGYEKRVLLKGKGELPDGAFDTPKLVALRKKGYQITGSMGAGHRADVSRLIFKP